jgi:hypothetical protein
MWIANGAEKSMCKLEGKVKYIVDPKHNTMKTYGGVEVKCHPFLTYLRQWGM